jgi:hypothetical protein
MKISKFGSVALIAGVLVFGLMMASRGMVKAQSNSLGFTLVNNNAAFDAGRPSLVMTKKNVLMVAFIETVNGVYNAFVKRWNGKSWEQIGLGSLNVDKKFNSFDVTLKLDQNDSPVVAWTERSNINKGKASGPGKIYVARWNGKSWQQFGQSPSKSKNSAPDNPILAIDARGYPLLGFSEVSPDGNVDDFLVKRWDGKAWQVIDKGSLSADMSDSSRSRDIGVTRSGTAILAYSRAYFVPGVGRTDFNVFAGTWSGNKWSALGGKSLNLDTNHYAGMIAMQLNAEDQPVIAWAEANKGFDVSVKRWNGKTWQPFGNTVNGETGAASNPKIALNAGGNPTVAWIESTMVDNVLVKTWNGEAWLEVGNNIKINPKNNADSCSIVLDSEGHPIIAWREGLKKSHQVLIKRFDGQAWVSLEP